MNLVNRVAITLGLITLSPFAVLGETPSQSLNAILQDSKIPYETSAQAVRLRDGAILWEKNPGRLLAPASVQKLVLSAAVLAALGPAERIRTPVFITGPIKDGILQGDLWIVGSGDPMLVSEIMTQEIGNLKHLGLKGINGNIYLDQTLFDREERNEARIGSEGVTTHAYDALVSALGINFNTISIAVAPSQVGGPARVNLDPFPLENVKIINQVRTVSGEGQKVSVERRSVGVLEHITVSGTIGIQAPLAKIYRSFGDGERTIASYIRGFFLQGGLSITGSVKTGRLPASAKLFHEIEGYEMRRIVAGLNNFSNNYLADVLLKKLSTTTDKGRPGSFPLGVQSLNSFLREKLGIEPSGYKLHDGSGLHPENRISANTLTQVLVHMEKRWDVFPDYLASLPASGWDGTLKKRFKGPGMEDIQGVIRAKTGTLTEPVTVSSLAGYFRSEKHGVVAFSILQNGQRKAQQPSLAQLRESQERLITELMRL